MTGGVSAACAPTKLFVTNNRRCILRHITQYKPLTNAYTRHFIRESAGEDFQVINPAGIELIRLQPSGLLAEMAEETVTFDFEDSLLGSGVFIWPTWQHFNHVLSTLVQSVTLDYSSMLIGTFSSAQ
jgi:hypothetical protein